MDETSLRSTLDAAGLVVWEYDFVLRKSTWSSPHVTILGYALATATADWQEQVHPDDLPSLEESLATARSGKGEFRCEFRLRKADGSWWCTEARGRTQADATGGIYLTALLADIGQRKRLEEDLQRTTTNFQRAQILSRTGSWSFDIGADALEGSSESCRLFGIKEGTVLSRTDFFSRIHPEDRRMVAHSWQAAMQHGSFESEFRILAGTVSKWVRVRATIDIGADSRAVSAFGTMQDITSRKVVDQALRESEERFARAFLANPAALAMARFSDGLIIDTNGACLELFGYARRQLVGHTMKSLGLFVEYRKLTERLKKNGQVRRWETRIRTQNEEFREVEISAEMIELDDEPCLLAMLLDIAERKDTEAALHESRLILEQAQSIGQMGSWTADLVARKFTINPDCARLVGLRPGVHASRDFEAIIPAEDRKMAHDTWVAALVARQPYEIEHRVQIGEQTRWLHIRAGFEYDENGHPVRSIGMIQDTSESRQNREMLEQYQAHLEDSVEARTRELEEAKRSAETANLLSRQYEPRNPYAAQRRPRAGANWSTRERRT